MIKHIIHFTLPLFFLLVSGPFCSAQADIGAVETYQSRIEFEGNDFDKDITLIVTENSNYFRLAVKGKIKGGRSSAVLYRKNGRRVCGLSLNAKKGGSAKGTMEEELEVREGIYILKIRNNDGHGYLDIDFSQR